MKIGYKVVNERGAKGVIVTAETIMDLRRWLAGVGGTDEAKLGAQEVIDFLEDSYRKAFR